MSFVGKDKAFCTCGLGSRPGYRAFFSTLNPISRTAFSTLHLTCSSRNICLFALHDCMNGVPGTPMAMVRAPPMDLHTGVGFMQ